MNNRNPHKNTALTALLFCMLMLSNLILTSCGSDSTVSSQTDTSPSTSSDTAVETEEIIPIEKRNFDGYEFKVLSISKEEGSKAPDDIYVESENGEVLNDAVYKRNSVVNDVMNVKITQAIPSVPRSGLAKFITPLLLAGDPIYDISLINFDTLDTVLFTKGANVDLKEITTLDLDAEWWDQESRSAFSVNGKEYTVTGAINLRTAYALYGVLFNTDMVSKLSLESPYKLVADGKWVVDEMLKQMQAVKADLNGDGQMDDNDRYGLIATNASFRYLLSGAGQELVIMGSNGIPEINKSEELYNAINKLYPVASQRYLSQAYANKTGNLSDLFISDQALFYQTSVGSGLRGMESNYGIIPAPKLNESYDRYYCPVACSTATALIVPSWNTDLDRVGYVTDALGYYSKEFVLPAYYESTLEAKAIRDDESLEMLDIMVNSKIFVLNDVFNFGKSQNILTGLVTSGTNNFASEYASFEGAIKADIDKFVESIS